MINKILNLFRKKEKIEPNFSSYAIVELSEVALQNGINDDFNKIIKVYKDGKTQILPYSKQQVEALIEVDEIPVIDKTKQGEDYEFLEVQGFGFIK